MNIDWLRKTAWRACGSWQSSSREHLPDDCAAIVPECDCIVRYFPYMRVSQAGEVRDELGSIQISGKHDSDKLYPESFSWRYILAQRRQASLTAAVDLVR